MPAKKISLTPEQLAKTIEEILSQQEQAIEKKPEQKPLTSQEIEQKIKTLINKKEQRVPIDETERQVFVALAVEKILSQNKEKDSKKKETVQKPDRVSDEEQTRFLESVFTQKKVDDLVKKSSVSIDKVADRLLKKVDEKIASVKKTDSQQTRVSEALKKEREKEETEDRVSRIAQRTKTLRKTDTVLTTITEKVAPSPQVKTDTAKANQREQKETRQYDTVNKVGGTLKALMDKLGKFKTGVEEEISKSSDSDTGLLMLTVAAALDDEFRKLAEVAIGLRRGFDALGKTVAAGVKSRVTSFVKPATDVIKAKVDSLMKGGSTTAKIVQQTLGKAGEKLGKATEVITKSRIGQVGGKIGSKIGGVGSVGLKVAQPVFLGMDVYSGVTDTGPSAFEGSDFAKGTAALLTGDVRSGSPVMREMLPDLVEKGSGLDKILGVVGAGVRGAAVTSKGSGAAAFTGVPAIVGGVGGMSAELVKIAAEAGDEELQWRQMKGEQDALIKRMDRVKEVLRQKGTDEKDIDAVVKQLQGEIQDVFKAFAEEKKKAGVSPEDLTELKDDMTLSWRKEMPWDQVVEKFQSVEADIVDTTTRFERIESANFDLYDRVKRLEERPLVKSEIPAAVQSVPKPPVSKNEKVLDKDKTAASLEQTVTNNIKETKIQNKTVVMKQAPADYTPVKNAVKELEKSARDKKKREAMKDKDKEFHIGR